MFFRYQQDASWFDLSLWLFNDRFPILLIECERDRTRTEITESSIIFETSLPFCLLFSFRSQYFPLIFQFNFIAPRNKTSLPLFCVSCFRCVCEHIVLANVRLVSCICFSCTFVYFFIAFYPLLFVGIWVFQYLFSFRISHQSFNDLWWICWCLSVAILRMWTYIFIWRQKVTFFSSSKAKMANECTSSLTVHAYANTIIM